MKTIETKTLSELEKAGFKLIPQTFPECFYKSDNGRTMIFEFAGVEEGVERYKRMYDGETKYVEGFISNRK